uniref:Uncharacterized protein n=1 Tax=Rheinheimera sp. BAL341 TaxID=1708203 RepID=A0A486XW02_9GAMM
MDLHCSKFCLLADLNLPSGGRSGKITRLTALICQHYNNQLR